MIDIIKVAALLAALAAPARSTAQSPPPLPSLPAQDVFRPGTWVQYVLTRTHGGEVAVMLVRLAALEREHGGQWFEIGFTDARRQTLSIKVLVEGSLQAPRRVLRAIVQPHGQQPLEFPERLAARQLPGFRADPGKDAKANSIKQGKARVTVAAGTFLAEHYRLADKGRTVDMWTSAQVAGWPMIKLQSNDLQLELAARGQGARSQIQGKPAKLDERWLGGPGAPGSTTGNAAGTSKP